MTVQTNFSLLTIDQTIPGTRRFNLLIWVKHPETYPDIQAEIMLVLSTIRNLFNKTAYSYLYAVDSTVQIGKF